MDKLEVVTIEARIPKVVDITIPTNGIIGTGYIAGPQGNTGLQGPKGEPGKDGKPFTYDMFTPEQLNALKGPQGPQGPAGQPADTSQFVVKTDFQLIIDELKKISGGI